ncbi:MAG: cob(I)yrinic acid a,c-diamide adenosyltransferase [Pirellulaceae bacterium]|nr:cob(I)yrinic acid a,c-diamide adenosyltransferase [Pirellulaceae bacterium]
MRIYTRQGDDGKTRLWAGPRVNKDDPRVEACGAVDELNAWLGLVRAEPLPGDLDQLLHRIQHELFGVGADLASVTTQPAAEHRVQDRHVSAMEQDIDALERELRPLTEFILPGGVRAAALLHGARTVCRRAERRVVSLDGVAEPAAAIAPIIRYLNRLSDLLFVLPRVVNARGAQPDESWRKDR